MQEQYLHDQEIGQNKGLHGGNGRRHRGYHRKHDGSDRRYGDDHRGHDEGWVWQDEYGDDYMVEQEGVHGWIGGDHRGSGEG